MEYIMIGLKLLATALLIIIAVYSWMYFSQIRKIEKQFGLKLPNIIRRLLTLLAMLPMVVSLVVIFVVFAELMS